LIWISFSFYITPAKINVQGVFQTKCKVKFREFIRADGVSNTVRGNVVREEATVSSNFSQRLWLALPVAVFLSC
jgi:hypothetical protein